MVMRRVGLQPFVFAGHAHAARMLVLDQDSDDHF
jgi:hypothetical protein